MGSGVGKLWVGWECGCGELGSGVGTWLVWVDRECRWGKGTHRVDYLREGVVGVERETFRVGVVGVEDERLPEGGSEGVRAALALILSAWAFAVTMLFRALDSSYTVSQPFMMYLRR